MAKYRKKHILTDPLQYTDMSKGIEDGFDTVIIGTVTDPGLKKAIDSWYPNAPEATHAMVPFIQTLEGKVYVAKGSFILTGPKGERYPCDEEVFNMTYEKIED
jgi:hypothetical protein